MTQTRGHDGRRVVGQHRIDRSADRGAQRGGFSTDFDLATYFLHDVPAEVIEHGAAHERPEANIVFGERSLRCVARGSSA
jgi:hypothetical protein